MNHNSPAFVAKLIGQIDSTKFNKDVFDKTGIFFVRNAIPKSLVDEWKGEWDVFYRKIPAHGRDGSFFSPLKDPLPQKLANIYKNNVLLDVAEQIFGRNIAILNHRFIVKDKFVPGKTPTSVSIDASNMTSHVATFLHHDFGYHIGNQNKASFFVPLGRAGRSNGGVTYYLGTHKYGYLGDLGEIDADQFKDTWPRVTPELEPGDFAIMNSLLWHKSDVNESGMDRVIVDTIYQPADDPSGKELARGEWQTDVFIQHGDRTSYFKTSRAKTIIEFKAQANGRGK